MAFDLVSAFASKSESPFYVGGGSATSATLDEAPQQITLRFSAGVKIDPATLGGITVVRSGGAGDPFGDADDVTVVPGSILVNDLPNQNEVVIRFADTLPDDSYRITIGGGAGGLKAVGGDTMTASRTIDLRLNLGAFVVSVVPQPVTRSGSTLSQDRNSIVVYFNREDPLGAASAQTTSSYRLFEVDAAGTDVSPQAPTNPTSVSYDAATGKAVLTFAAGAIADGKLFRLQVGAASQLVAAATPVNEGSDENSSFTTARNLGAIDAAGATVNGAIQTRATVTTPSGAVDFPVQPGSIDEPGHRDLPGYQDPADIGDHGLLNWSSDPAAATAVVNYNFQSVYGVDGQGNTLYNAITETQKQRAREVFELFSRQTGIRFVETASSGITVVTGDVRALDPSITPGLVAGLGSTLPAMAIMSSLENWGSSEYAGRYFKVAMHEIGHALGLEHSYDLPSIMGQGLTGEPVFPGDYDKEHLAQLAPANGSDVDVYKFTLAAKGRLTAETVIARPGQVALSQLDSLLTLYREVGGKREIVARNDDSFGRDSFLGLDLEAGTYFIAVTSVGNDKFNPEVSDSGYGGQTAGAYQLKLGFQPASTTATTIADTSGTLLDGDRDGKPGGAFNFWFNTASTADTVFVDKTAANGGTGSIVSPYNTIKAALDNVGARKIIRIVGNAAGTPYLVGTDQSGRALADGATFNVPANVTVMIDEGAVFKLRAANIDVGSSSPLVSRGGASLQVLGTPTSRVTFTSYHDDTIGGNSDNASVLPAGGQWGGLVLRKDSDAASKRAFVNTIGQADIRFGGGVVSVDSKSESFAPVQLESTRPTIAFNTITKSAGAAIAADPNSFEETGNRVGPELRGNRLLDNTTNGLFVKIRTEFGSPVDRLDVPARFKSTDIVYVIQENLLINGGVGGYQQVGANVQARQSGRLTIDPGVVVKMQGARIELERGTSQLIAEGTASQRVVFTSLGDSRYGAGGTFDTNGNLPDMRTAGDWGGIVLNAGSKASIDYAYIAYGGGQTPIEGTFDSFNVIETHQGDLRLAHSRIENNAAGTAVTNRTGRGSNAAATVFVRGAQPVILGNDFRDNLGATVSVNVNSLSDVERPDSGRVTGGIDRDGRYDDNRGLLVRDNRVSYTIDAAAGRPSGGAILGMEVRGEEVTVESVWDDVDIVHVLRNEVIVNNFHTATGVRLMSRPDASLIVKLLGAEAGITAAGEKLDIDDRIGGTVQVVGQPKYPVVFTSLKDDTVGASLDPLGVPTKDTGADGASTPAAGDWRSLKFLPTSNDRNVSVVQESEKAATGGVETNASPSSAQALGVLAPNFATGTNTTASAQEKSGDDNRRLGFEVHGQVAANDPTDVDVYSFLGYAGSEVWIDIDKTSPALDAMIELLDASGTVKFRSTESQLGSPTDPDFYSTNPKDPGLRLVLPSLAGQPVGTLTQYYVRVRSQPRYEPVATGADNGGVTATTQPAYDAILADATKLKTGATSGGYELRVRLRQLDEKPGSTVRYADIRYPTIGIDVRGLPNHSPLTGEAGEAGAANESFASAQYVGNLLESDRQAISIAGKITDEGDIDWYTFALNFEQIQSIGGLSSALKTFSTVFDIDYADGFRGDLTISVFDDKGKLIYVGRDSNVASDQPGAGQGNDFDDLSRGTLGKLDPYIGSVQMPAGNPTGSGSIETGGEITPPDPSKQLRYYVAVSSNERLPQALDATFKAVATNAGIRLEPVASIKRIAEDHIGFSGYTSGPKNNPVPAQIDPVTPSLIDISTALTLTTNVTPFTLSDVTLFVTSGSSLRTVDAMRGGVETFFGNNVGGADDIVMRADGKLYAYTHLGGAANTAGQLSILDTGNGARTIIGNDSIPDLPATTSVTEVNLPATLVGGTGVLGSTVSFTLANNDVQRATAVGTLQYSFTPGVGLLPVTGSWNFTTAANGAMTFTAAVTEPTGIATPLNGTVAANGTISVTFSQPVQAAGVLLATTTYTFIPNRNAVTTDAVDALAWDWTSVGTGVNRLFYSVREGGQSRLYAANGGSGLAAEGRVGTYMSSGGVVTGMAFVNGTLYGVDDAGHFFTINTGSAAVTQIQTFAGVQFSGLAIGPQNLAGGPSNTPGYFKDKLFAIDSSGTLRALDTAGNLLQVFDSDGNGSADATSIDSGAFGATGLAFSPLDVNLWHPTTRRGTDAGHGVAVAPDNSRDGEFERTIQGRKNKESEGGVSMYFGLSQYVGGTSPTPYLNYDAARGQYGAQTTAWQQDLTSSAEIGNNYNLPGGAYGSLTTNTFSLTGYDSTDKPTLYFNYWLQTQNAESAFDKNFMRDSARVFVSIDGGLTWEVVATNNSAKSKLDTSDGELPAFASASSRIADPTLIDNQHVQELHDAAAWRQARIDLGKYAGQGDVRLRFDFSTAGEFDAGQRNAAGDLVNDIRNAAGGTSYANTTGNFNSLERGQQNAFEGFYVDDIIVGFAERGEMVTGAQANQTTFFDTATPESASVPATIARQSLTGEYQLEIRGGGEYASLLSLRKKDTILDGTKLVDTNANQAGDSNRLRDQGQFLIEANTVANALTYGISIDAGERDSLTNAPATGAVRNLAVLNNGRLVPGVVVTNNVVSNSGVAGILFSGDANSGNAATAPVPYGRIVNNTIYGGTTFVAGASVTLAATTVSGQRTITVPATSGLRVGMLVTGLGIPVGARIASIVDATTLTLSQNATADGTGVSLVFAYATIGVEVTENAGPTLLNNLIVNVDTGVSVDASSRLDDAGNQRTVVGTSAYYNVGTQVSAGAVQSQQVVLTGDPFVNAATGNFYLAAGSRAIDSSLNSLGDRAETVAVASPLGIPESPIIAPAFDLYGQLRDDDPSQASLPGLGSNVFKDRGAIDRVDVLQPYLSLATPQDGGTADADSAADSVLLKKEDARGLTRFVLQLSDNGVGIDKATVTSAAFTLKRDGATLVAGTDYLFRYFENSNQVVFESAAFFPLGSYVVTATTRPNVAGGAVGLLTDLANNTLLPNQSNGTAVFTIALADVPGAPTNVVGTAGEGQVSLAWSAPAAGAAAVTDYVIQLSTDGGSVWTTFTHAVSPATTAIVSGLTNGTPHVFRVAAVNAVGQGDWSVVSAAVTPQALPPSAPTGVTGVFGDGSVAVSWTAPSPGTSPITDYEIQFSSNNGTSWTPFIDGTSTATTATVTPLVNGTAYVFQVRAVNKNGASPWSAASASVTPLAPAAAPSVTGVIVGDAQVELSWTTPASNGSPITGYVVQTSADGGANWATTNVGVVNSTVISGLVNGGSYVFRVAAITAAGAGNFSSPTSPVTPLGLPGIPTGLSATAGDGSARLTWSAPGANGGRPITDYVVQYRELSSGTWLTLAHPASTATSAVVSGLTNGASYVFQVAAVTSFGQGGFSAQSAAVSPLQLAGAPTRLTGRAADGTVSLVWTAPRMTAGQRIVDYVIDYSSDGGATWTRAADAVSAATRATVAVPNGITYVFRVAAVTAGGVGAFSLSSGSLTPFARGATPAAPTGLVGIGSGGTIALSWTGSPANAGGRTSDYVIQYRLSTSSRWVTVRDGVSSSTSALVSRLVTGRSYVFRVAAKNLAGQGAFSAETAEVIA